MMSTKITCGCTSAMRPSASKPSFAVTTSHPSFFSRVSAVRRMVFESSMTMTLRPARAPDSLLSLIAFPKSAVGGGPGRPWRAATQPISQCQQNVSSPRPAS